jgi:AMP-binding enzyme
VALVIVAGHAGGRTAVHGVPVVELGAWLNGHAADPPAAVPAPSDLAVLMFTSGTSGGSKAAMWSHHRLYLASAGVSDALEHTPDGSPPHAEPAGGEVQARRRAGRPGRGARVRPSPQIGLTGGLVGPANLLLASNKQLF